MIFGAKVTRAEREAALLQFLSQAYLAKVPEASLLSRHERDLIQRDFKIALDQIHAKIFR